MRHFHTARFRFVNSRFAGAPVLAIAISLLLLACEPKQTPPPVEPTPTPAIDDPALTAATEQLWQRGGEILAESTASVATLTQAIEQLLSDPTDATLNAARTSWQDSHHTYQQFALFTALGESNPGLFGQLHSLNFSVDAHPIQPGFIDYFSVYTQSGIVNDIAMPLTAEALREQHGLTDLSDVSLGYHAIEYLLWGEQGERPVTDYQAINTITTAQQTAGLRVVDLPNNRRRTLLRLLANLLADDMEQLHAQWTDANSPIARNYLALPPQGRLQLVEAAAHSWALGYAAEMQNFIPRDAAEEESDLSEAGIHSPFAGGNAQLLAQQLLTLETTLLTDETGLGAWALDAETRQSLRSQVAALRESLANWDQPWPPTGATQQPLVDTFVALLDVLSREDLSTGNVLSTSDNPISGSDDFPLSEPSPSEPSP